MEVGKRVWTAIRNADREIEVLAGDHRVVGYENIHGQAGGKLDRLLKIVLFLIEKKLGLFVRNLRLDALKLFQSRSEIRNAVGRAAEIHFLANGSDALFQSREIR